MSRLEVVPEVGHGLVVESGERRVLGDDDAAAVGVLRGRSAGQVLLDDRPLPARPAERVRRGLAVVADAPVAPDVAVVDHLAAMIGFARAAALLAAAPLLAGRGADPAGVLSGGERRVVAWLRAIALDPGAVFLDRAGEGLDPAALTWARGQVDRWAAAGAAIVIHPGRREERAWADPWPPLSPSD